VSRRIKLPYETFDQYAKRMFDLLARLQEKRRRDLHSIEMKDGRHSNVIAFGRYHLLSN